MKKPDFVFYKEDPRHFVPKVRDGLILIKAVGEGPKGDSDVYYVGSLNTKFDTLWVSFKGPVNDWPRNWQWGWIHRLKDAPVFDFMAEENP